MGGGSSGSSAGARVRALRAPPQSPGSTAFRSRCDSRPLLRPCRMFHELKRFVRVANEQLSIRGRLMTIGAFSFTSDQSFPKTKA